jgi:hypothetical protein
MKKYLLLVIILLSCLTANAQSEGEVLVSIAKKNWVGADNPASWYSDGTGVVEIVDEGLAITNFSMQDNAWDTQTAVLWDFSLEEGHSYIVRLTVKVPSDGTYHLGMGSWDGRGIWTSCQVPVQFGDSYQVIDVEYPEYQGSVYGDGLVFLGCGWVVGSTIIKEVELLEKTTTAGIQSLKPVPEKVTGETLYNLAGQKVDASYKGIVIKNGKKVVK